MSDNPEFTMIDWLHDEIEKHQNNWGCLPTAIHLTKKQLLDVFSFGHPDLSGVVTYTDGIPSRLFGIPVVLDDDFWLETPEVYKETIGVVWDGNITAGSMIIGDPDGTHMTIDSSGVKINKKLKDLTFAFEIPEDTINHFNESLTKAAQSMVAAGKAFEDCNPLGGLPDDPATVVFTVRSKDHGSVTWPISVVAAKPPPYWMVHHGAVLDLSDLGLPERVRVVGVIATPATWNDRTRIKIECYDYLGLLPVGGEGLLELLDFGDDAPWATFE